MIVNIKIENFRSIKEETTFSLAAARTNHLIGDNVAQVANGTLGVVASAGIYGANASGKSNVLIAFEVVRYMAAVSSSLKEDAKIPCYEPYLLSDSTRTSPVRLEVEFINKDDIRYIYTISYTRDAILEESLDFFPLKHKANIFKRVETDTWETISFGGKYTGGSKRIAFFKNNSYLAVAGNNPAAAKLIRSVCKYFVEGMVHIGRDEPVVVSNFFERPQSLGLVSKFLCSVDTGISSIEAKLNKNPIVALPEGFPSQLKNMILEKQKRSFFFGHKTETGEIAQFREALESEGTQKLFQLLPVIMSAISEGKVLIMDELDSSLHPHIAELIIRLFNDAEVNANGAQLIFSTHNIALMASNNLRRDQIWFTEKIDGKTNLYSLDEFDKATVKATSPFDRWYADGRFGALPAIDYLAIKTLFKEQLESESQLPEHDETVDRQ